MTSSRRIHRRALVGLGALLLVLYMWPFICVAAIPVPSMLFRTPAQSQPQPPVILSDHQHPNQSNSDPSHNETAAKPPSDSKTMLNVLNETHNDTMATSEPNRRPTNTSSMDAALMPSDSAAGRPSVITDDGNNKVSTDQGAVVSPIVRTTRRTPIDTVNSERSEHSHDEIEFKIKPAATQTDLNLDARNPTTMRTIVHAELHQQNTDDAATTLATNHEIVPRPRPTTINAAAFANAAAATTDTSILWTTESNSYGPSAGTDATASYESIEVGSGRASGDRVVAEPRRRGASRNHRSINQRQALSSSSSAAATTSGSSSSSSSRRRNSHLERNERSANLSHIMGTTRKIQLLMKNRLIQIMPDGTVNGTQDDQSEYTILQRGTVGIGQVRIQAVATCLFLCMDACGSVYATREFANDCIFNETMQENYNIYSSLHHSTAQRTYYLALNKLGQPRKTHLPAGKELGKLATYAKSLTYTVPEKQTEAVIGRVFGVNHVKHGLKQLCDSGKSLVPLTASAMKPRPKCAPMHQQQPAVSTASPAIGNRGLRKHRNGSSSLTPEKARKGGGARCLEDGTVCPKRRKSPHPRQNGGGGGGGVGAVAPTASGADQSNMSPGQMRQSRNGKKPHPNKKGHRRKKVKDGDLTAKARGGDRPPLTTTTESPADEEANTDHFGVTSTDSSNSNGAPDDENDPFESGVPATGFTSFADDIGDDFSD